MVTQSSLFCKYLWPTLDAAQSIWHAHFTVDVNIKFGVYA